MKNIIGLPNSKLLLSTKFLFIRLCSLKARPNRSEIVIVFS